MMVGSTFDASSSSAGVEQSSRADGTAEEGRRMKFRATIQPHGKTATGIQVPAEIVASLGSSKRPPVRVTINGHTYRSSVASMGGEFMLGVSAENRLSADVVAGDEVDIVIELDTEPRAVTMPPDFTTALDRDADARRFFDSLSYSHQRRYVLAIEEAKTAETRQRRITKTVSILRDGQHAR